MLRQTGLTEFYVGPMSTSRVAGQGQESTCVGLMKPFCISCLIGERETHPHAATEPERAKEISSEILERATRIELATFSLGS